MNNNVLLSWDKPLVLVEHERQTRLHEPTRRGLRMLIASILIHLAFVLYVYIAGVYVWFPTNRPLLPVLFVSIFLMPAFYFVGLRGECLKRERHYELREDGILDQAHDRKILRRWQALTNYAIKAHLVFPSIKIADIEGAKGWKGCQLIFDTNEVPEETITSLLQTKLKL